MSLPISHQAIELNNLGATYMQNGFHSQACTALTKALYTVRNTMEEGLEDDSCHRQKQQQQQQHPSERTVTASATPIEREERYMACEPVMVQDANGFLVYVGATSFLPSTPHKSHSARRSRRNSTDNDGAVREATVSISTVSAVVVFNLALACHLHSVCPGLTATRRHHASVKAVRLYENAHRLHVQQMEDEEAQFGVARMPVKFIERTMAILNNLSHLHTLLDNQQRAQQCSQQLMQSLFWAQQQEDIVHSMTRRTSSTLSFSSLASPPVGNGDLRREQRLLHHQHRPSHVFDGLLENVMNTAMKFSVSAAAA